MSFLEYKYITLISYRLEKFVRKSATLFNFRCPYCLDSKTNKNKARGYLYEKEGAFFYHCHNCGDSRSFSRFLKSIDLGIYNDFQLEKIKEKGVIHKEIVKKPNIKVEFKEDPCVRLEKISDLDRNHYARKYLVSRRLPESYFEDLYYAREFEPFINEIIPEKFDLKKITTSPRIVIPLRHNTADKKGVLHGIQGRSLDPNNSAKYITINVDDNYPKVFGVDRVDFNRDFYVLEGPFDSMFIENSIAVCGSDFHTILSQLPCDISRAILIYDNEPRNREIIKKIEKSIDLGYRVLIWPQYVFQKDINSMILNEYSKGEIKLMLDHQVFKGLSAKNEFTKWKRL